MDNNEINLNQNDNQNVPSTVKVENNKKGPMIIIIVLVLIIVGLCSYIVYDKITSNNNNQSNENPTSDISTDNKETSSNKSDSSINDDSSSKSDKSTDEEIIEEQFEEWLKDKDSNIVDYSIDNIEIQNSDDNGSLGYNEDDVLVLIKFSVKTSGDKTIWIAGNGEEKGDYVSASRCGYLRNGKLTITGTSW